jgi:phosphoribosylformimino-5-aminoimidazole carboxamide ribotide isomerase
MQLWAAVDLLDGKVVRLREGRLDACTVYSPDPVRVAQRWAQEGADGLHLVDLNRTFERGSNLPLVRAILQAVHVPVQYGGGVRTPNAAEQLWEAGVARVIFGTLAYREPIVLQRLLREHGSGRCMVAIDHRNGQVMMDGWREPAPLDVVGALARFTTMGIESFLVTAIHRDGLLAGPDGPRLAELRARVRAHLVASGGIATLDDLRQLRATGVDGVVLGKALYEERIRLAEAKAQLIA